MLSLSLLACTGGGSTTLTPPPQDGPTYYRDAAPILAEHCTSCHRPGDIAPFPLETYEDAAPWAAAIAADVQSGKMPPWPPSGDCRPLVGDRSLADDEIATLVAWGEAGGPEGDPADAVEVTPPPEFQGDVTIEMSEPYTPPPRTDDYRCFVLDWPATTDSFAVAYQVEPGRRDLVHHVILGLAGPDQADQVRAADDADPGPGYACFGSLGSGITNGLGSWVPGVQSVELPATTGIELAPGSVVVMQVHYNTTATDAPDPDQTSLVVKTAPSVQYPAVQVGVLDPQWLLPGGMPIPAGESDVRVDGTASALALGAMASSLPGRATDPLRIWRTGLHMHLLGTEGGVEVQREDGSSECLLEIPRWDFHWQGGYTLAEPVTISGQDQVHLWCQWDNSAPDAVDVEWGEGTSDEMCLSGLYVTR